MPVKLQSEGNITYGVLISVRPVQESYGCNGRSKSVAKWLEMLTTLGQDWPTSEA